MRCFYYALRGIRKTLLTERNMRIHLAAAFYIAVAGFVCRIEAWQWCAVLGCIALVTALECINTALEAVCDLACGGEFSPLVEKAKDAAAGAVLAAAILSAVIGCVVFFGGGYVPRALEFASQNPVWAAAIVLTVPLWVKFIFFMRGSKHAGDN